MDIKFVGNLPSANGLISILITEWCIKDCMHQNVIIVILLKIVKNMIYVKMKVHVNIFLFLKKNKFTKYFYDK